MRRLSLVQDDNPLISGGPANPILGKFPDVIFRKKRLTIAIHAQFDLQSAAEVEGVRALIGEAMDQLSEQAAARISYTVCDL